MAKKKQPVKGAKNSSKKVEKRPGFFARIGNFFKGVLTEFKKVNWPSGNELVQHTLVVIGIVIIFTAVIYLFDLLLGYGKGLLM